MTPVARPDFCSRSVRGAYPSSLRDRIPSTLSSIDKAKDHQPRTTQSERIEDQPQSLMIRGCPLARSSVLRTSGIVWLLKKIRQTQVDQVLNLGRQLAILLAGDVHPAQDVTGHLTSRILDQDARGNVLAGTNPPDKFPLVLGQRVGSDGRNPPPTVQQSLGVTHVQGLSGTGERTPVLISEAVGLIR